MGDAAPNGGSRLFLRMFFYKGLGEDAEGSGVGGRIKAEKLSNKKRLCLKEAEVPGVRATVKYNAQPIVLAFAWGPNLVQQVLFQ